MTAYICPEIRIRFTLSTYWLNYEHKQGKSMKNIIWTPYKLKEMRHTRLENNKQTVHRST